MKTVLILAATDPSGGAGAFADVRTATLCGCYAMAIPTALTVQNTLGVKEVVPVDADLTARQLKAVLEDIIPDAVKIGAIPNLECACTISALLRKYAVKHIVLDPVISSTGGFTLGSVKTVETLFSLCELVTPNLPEAQKIADTDENCCDKLAAALAELHCVPFLVKGGHRNDGRLDDVLALPNGKRAYFHTNKLNCTHTHGTGCFLSTAIASNLASGRTLIESITAAKAMLESILAKPMHIGHGNGPVGM